MVSMIRARKTRSADAFAFFGDLRNKDVLDIGCGLGRNSIALARLGANVTAVDISRTAIEKLNRFANVSELSIKGLVSDAFSIPDLGQFDFVVGSMILHHLEPFDSFCDVLLAVMKPGGKALFYENNSASRLLVWMRENVVGKLWIPKNSDADGFPLKPQEVNMLRKRFQVVQVFPS
jgi:2-polyprenyl-3-methyl-5-hydroxy-6-metoxy-1,4-benzoquinol methylase